MKDSVLYGIGNVAVKLVGFILRMPNISLLLITG